MSHRTELKTKLDNKKYILDALGTMGCKFTEAEKGQKLRTKSNYSGVPTDVDILIHSVKDNNIKDAIGLRKEKDGTFSIVGDYWNTGISERDFTANVQMQSKKIEISDRLSEHGFDLSEELNENNNKEINLVYSRYV